MSATRQEHQGRGACSCAAASSADSIPEAIQQLWEERLTRQTKRALAPSPAITATSCGWGRGFRRDS